LFFEFGITPKIIEKTTDFIYSTSAAFAALKADGSIVVCGSSSDGGSGAPSGNGYIKIYSTAHAFAAVKADGSITAWGNSDSGGTTPAGRQRRQKLNKYWYSHYQRVHLCLHDLNDPTL
jgi:hypothetical protein